MVGVLKPLARMARSPSLECVTAAMIALMSACLFLVTNIYPINLCFGISSLLAVLHLLLKISYLDSGRASLTWDLVYGDLDLHDIEVEPCGDSYCQVCHTYWARRSCPNSFLDFDRIWPVSS